MSRNQKIKVLEAALEETARQLRRATDAMVVHEQIARDAMSSVVNQANEIVEALTHDLTLALNLLAQYKPPAQHALALLQIEMAKQDGEGINPKQFTPDEPRSVEGLLFEAAGLVRLVIARHTPQPDMEQVLDEMTPFDVDHAPEIATFLAKIEELKERNREQPSQPGDRSVSGDGTRATGCSDEATEGMEFQMPVTR